MVSSSKLRSSFPPSRRPALTPPPSDFEVTAAELERITWPDDLREAPTALESGDFPCNGRGVEAASSSAQRGLSSDLDDDVPTLARPAPPVAPRVVVDRLGGTILRERFGAAVRYAERVVVVPPGTDPVETVAIARGHAAELRLALPDDAAGRYVRVAVFDHEFHHAPLRPPVADVADKDWPSPAARPTTERSEVRPPQRATRAIVLALGFGLTLGSIATSLALDWTDPPVTGRAEAFAARP